MAANYNKVILAGNLTRDPQMSYLPNQTPVVEIGLAVNRRWKSQDGQQKEETCFVDCRAYGRQAETMNQYLSKGRPVLVEGRLQYSQWEDQSGAKKNKLRVVIEQFQFLGSPQGQGGGQGGQAQGGQGQGGQGQSQGGNNYPSQTGGGQAPQAPTGGQGFDDFGGGPAGGDEIPF
jgi:single-strand DNA-binding protein